MADQDDRADAGGEPGEEAEVLPENADPIAALKHKQIAVRASACRDLSRAGRLEHLPLLIELARVDRSPAVRLGCAAAASDILSRHRLGPAREALDAAGRDALLRACTGIDPAHNPGLFAILACLDAPGSLRRILVGLKDLRGEVRLGASVGLMRLCASAARAGDAALEDEVLGLLADRRLRPDAHAELARVCAAGGYVAALERLEGLELGDVQQELVNQMIAVLRRAGSRPVGLWFSDGTDAGEVNPSPSQPPAALLVGEDGAWWAPLGGPWAPLPLDGLRRLHLRRVGAAVPGDAVQVAGRTWYAEADTAGALEPHLDPSAGLPAPDPAWGPWAEALEAAVRADPSGAALRVVGLAAAQAGRLEAAEAALTEALGARRCPPDVGVLIGMVRAARGDTDGARAAYADALPKIRKKRSWYAIWAKDALEGQPG